MTTGSIDRELRLKAITGFAVGLALLIVVAAAVMWLVIGVLRDAGQAGDPPLPVLPEARLPAPPPEPRLQTDPVAELMALREREQELLTGWAWVDETAGIARVPVERAMELLVAEGLPPAVAAAPAPAAAAPPAEGLP